VLAPEKQSAGLTHLAVVVPKEEATGGLEMVHWSYNLRIFSLSCNPVASKQLNISRAFPGSFVKHAGAKTEPFG
jgi:hypothetical protein